MWRSPLSALTPRPGGNLTAYQRHQLTKSWKHWEFHCISASSTDTVCTSSVHTEHELQPIKRCLEFGPMRFQGGRGYTVLLKYKPKCLTKHTACWRRWLGPKVRYTRRMLLLLLVASLRMAGKLCYLSEKEMKEEKVGKGRTDTPLGRSFWELFDLFFSSNKSYEAKTDVWRLREMPRHIAGGNEILA